MIGRVRHVMPNGAALMPLSTIIVVVNAQLLRRLNLEED